MTARKRGGDASKALTRAKATPSETAERVDRIADLMRRGEWERGVSGPVLAKEWGLADNTVTQLASEASRVVAREVVDPTAVTETVATTLAAGLQQAARRKEFRAMAQLADVWTRVVGARAPERHEHAVVVAQFEALPREGKLRWVRERIEKLQEAERALLAAGEVDEPRG